MACGFETKRGRVAATPSAVSLAEPDGQPGGECLLLCLPQEVVEIILSHLDSRTLVQLEQVCSWFRQQSRGCRMTVTEKAAKEAVLRYCGGSLAEATRWRCGEGGKHPGCLARPGFRGLIVPAAYGVRAPAAERKSLRHYMKKAKSPPATAGPTPGSSAYGSKRP